MNRDLQHGEHSFEGEVKPIHSMIKVIGVGGAGTNAVSYMYENIENINCIVCNTDDQHLNNSPVPTKIRLGNDGNGAGTNPEVGRLCAEESINELQKVIKSTPNDPTKMVFITAGMGGGTGTGAAPVVARLAKESGLLTIGIVTYPYRFEGRMKKKYAFDGLEELKKYCDTTIIIMNDRVFQLFPDMPMSKANIEADKILAHAVKGISELINKSGQMNTDFRDVEKALKNAGEALIGYNTGDGENRAVDALKNALNSPLLLDKNIEGAKRVLLNIVTSKENEVKPTEVSAIMAEVKKQIKKDYDNLKFGFCIDDSLGTKLQITLICAGFNLPEEEIIIFENNELNSKIKKQEEEEDDDDGRYDNPFSSNPTKKSISEPEESKKSTVISRETFQEIMDEICATGKMTNEKGLSEPAYLRYGLKLPNKN